METRSFQERLVSIGKGFDKLIHVVKLPKSGKQEIVITYKGDEVFEGVHSSTQDVEIRQVEQFAGETKVRVLVKCPFIGTQQRSIVFYFEPSTPFYLLDKQTVIPNTKKLKQAIQFQITGFSEFDNYEYNTEEVLEGSDVDFSFNYIGQNKIIGVKGTCGCTNVQVDGNRIFGKLTTQDIKGNFSKTINVYFGDYQRQYESINGVLLTSKDSYTTTLIIRGSTISN